MIKTKKDVLRAIAALSLAVLYVLAAHSLVFLTDPPAEQRWECINRDRCFDREVYV